MAPITENMVDDIVTDLKLLHSLMDDSVGRIISADMSSAPTRFIDITMMTSIRTAISILYSQTLVPELLANASSNVTAYILLKNSIKNAIDTIASTQQVITLSSVSVRMDVAPNKKPHTSPETLPELEYRLSVIYPKASPDTEITAKSASEGVFLLSVPLNSKIENAMVTGSVMYILFVIPAIIAIQADPNVICDSPSPINDIFWVTMTEPISAEQSAIRIPVINAYFTKSYDVYSIICRIIIIAFL